MYTHENTLCENKPCSSLFHLNFGCISPKRSLLIYPVVCCYFSIIFSAASRPLKKCLVTAYEGQKQLSKDPVVLPLYQNLTASSCLFRSYTELFVVLVCFERTAHVYGDPYMQCTNIFFQCTTYIYSVHKCISECTNLFLSVQINFSVHKSISQCTTVFLSAQN